MCYYTNWAVYRNGNAKYDAKYMYPYLCTHVIYAFANIDGQTLAPTPTDPWSDLPSGLDNFRKVTSLKNINPELKVLLSVGGWERLLSEFQLVSGSEQNSKLFAKNTKNYLKKYNFDGFDVDWEYPNDKAKYTRMMKALSEEFKRDSSDTFLLTAAVSAGMGKASVSYDISTVSKHLDYINIMTYDFYGQFSHVVGHHSGLFCSNENDEYCTDFAVRYWHNQGTPLSKILIGIPTYAQGFKTTSKNPRVGDVKVGGTPMGHILYNSGILSYLEYCNEGYRNVWDDNQKVAHGEKDYYWLGYETTRSIHEKANYVKDNGLAGMFVWTLDFDDFSGKECHNGKSPLIGAIHKELNIYPGIDWESISNDNLSPRDATTTQSTKSSNNDVDVPDKNNVCSRIGYVPLDGCTKYLNCAQIGSTGYVQSCGDGLLFDVKTSTCNWKYLVNCENYESTTVSATEKKTTSSTTQLETTSTEGITVKPTTRSPTTQSPTTEETTTTTRSTQTVPTTQSSTTEETTTTTRSTQTVPTTQSSTTEETTTTTRSTQTVPTTQSPTTEEMTTTTNAPTTTEFNDIVDSDGNCKKAGYFPWDECRKFVVCGYVGYRGYYFNCPTGTLFDENAKVCNFKFLVKCNSKASKEDQLSSDGNIDGDGRCRKVGYFAVDGCKKFINCGFVGQIATPMNCPGNLLFDTTINNCNYPYMVNCSL